MSDILTRIVRRGVRVSKKLTQTSLREMDLNHLLRQRRLDVCCCGLSKTGTHSLAGLFENYRNQHHPDVTIRIPLSIATLNSNVDMAHASKVLKQRDRKMWLEMESSTLAGILIEPLLQACPEKKFILSIRDVYSWCDSWIDHNINNPPHPSSRFAALDRIRLRGREFPSTKYDTPLVELGFPSLASYFQLWASHNARVLKAVPPERLFVIKTGEIIERMNEVACWVGVEPAMLRADRGWLASTPIKHGILGTMDPSYVQDTAMLFCGYLMEQYFPDALVRSPSQ